MPGERLSDIQYRVGQLYGAEEYVAAFDLMFAARGSYPDDQHEFRYWCTCLAARAGSTQEALDLVEAELMEGGWFSQAQLREDDDLDSLQGLPRFERLAEECLARQQRAQAKSAAALFQKFPPGVRPSHASTPTLLALHGNQQNGRHALKTWDPITHHGYRLAALQSSQLVSHESYSWNDWERAAHDLQQHLPAILEHADADYTILGGFSMGAGFALQQSLAVDDLRAEGFIGVGTFLPDIDILQPLLMDIRPDTLRCFLVVGGLDDPCFEVSQQVAHLLEARDQPCILEVHPGLVHDFPVDFAQSLSRALAFIRGA